MRINTQARQQALLKQLPECSGVLLWANREQIRNNDVHYPFRQNSSFEYITGFNEPNAVALLTANEGLVLFVRPKDKTLETWEGYRAGPEGAIHDFGATEAFNLAELESQLLKRLDGIIHLYLPMGDEYATNYVQKVIQTLKQQARAGKKPPQHFIDIEPLIAQMRLIKDKEEMENMRFAANISARAHTQLMQQCKAGLNEAQLHAQLLYTFKYHGGEEAYNSIVAGGENACILHYTKNNQSLNNGDLVLIDAGMEYQGYAADITRTFPVSGKFSPAQKAIYNVVLSAQLAAIEACQASNTFNDPHEAAIRVLTEGLIDLKLLTGTVQENIEKHTYRRFYMHRTGHWLGKDVHDVGAYKDDDGIWMTLRAGMVLTVEPGLYISNDVDIPAEYHHIGVRIEDDILITDQGCENLTQGVVKTTDDIEAVMRG